MRILIVNNFSYVTGGADRHCFDVAQLLREAGHDVAFLATSSPTQVEKAGAFVPLMLTNATRDDVSPLVAATVAVRSFWNRSAEGAMRELLREFRPDVLSVHKVYPHLSVAPLVVARRAGVPIVQTVHDFEFVSANPFDHTGGKTDQRESRVQYRALNSALFRVKRGPHVRLVDRWIAVSRAIAATYASYGVHADVLPNFTLTGPEDPPSLSSRSGALYAGRLTEEKGVREVLEMARLNPDVPVRVAGQGPLAPVVRAAAERCPNLTYFGAVTQAEVQMHLRASRVCLMPSSWPEPGPLACLESMAAGTPVVCYGDAGGLAEYVTDAGAGIAVAREPGAFVAASSRLLTEDAAWREMSSHARLALKARHAPDNYVASLTRIFSGVVEQ
jgi:glycosyltransferase involved in cell wall biosynthesis